jgi:tetratricopeptide (TPR) repeat protein
MPRKRARETRKQRAARLSATVPTECGEIDSVIALWIGEQFRFLVIAGFVAIAVCTILIYGQTVSVPALEYEDSFYLVHSPYIQMNNPWDRLPAIWTEPYFANFHPVTTTSWLLDRALANKDKAFDAIPFRLANLGYAVMGAALLLLLYRRLGIPKILAVLGALIWAAHPVHTEVIAWLSARKDLISLLFIVLSLLSWIWARTASTPNQWRVRHATTILLVLLAVLSKPIAVILPALFIAYEFCSAPHPGVGSWRWAESHNLPPLTRALALTGILITLGGGSAVVFKHLLTMDQMHGGWLIVLVIIVSAVLLMAAPSELELATFCQGRSIGTRVLAPAFLGTCIVFGAGCAWTFWAQNQVGAIKGGLPVLSTLNLTFDAMLSYLGKTLVPIRMSVSYNWSEYPYFSLRGAIGAVLILGAAWLAMGLGGAKDRRYRLAAFGIFWYLIALIPVSNLVPTSTKMADRYLFVPTAGAILALLALASIYASSRTKQAVVLSALLVVVCVYAFWAQSHTTIWCGATTSWNGSPQPDLSLWSAAVETNPGDTHALTSRALAYLHLIPPQADKALLDLNRALQLSEATQHKIAGDRQLILSPLYEALGDAYFTKAAQLSAAAPDADAWQDKKEAYHASLRYFELAANHPSGFASADARVLNRLAEGSAGLAVMDAQEYHSASLKQARLLDERDDLRNKSEEYLRLARQKLVAGNVSPADSNYRMVILDEGNLIFNREMGTLSDQEKASYYNQALTHYQEAASLFPDDPRPWLYEGLCHERLTAIASSAVDKQLHFEHGQTALRTALTLHSAPADYSPALAYQAMASLYAHVNDFRSALDSLQKAWQADPANPDAPHLQAEIQSIEQYLTQQRRTP